MRITKLKLENAAGLYVGSNLDSIELNFNESKNRIILIEGKNTSGKSSLISSLSPFSGPTSLDDRHSLPFIRVGKNGYKEIHFQDHDDEYIIKHYYKATKDTHSLKSYFSLNGKKLNENGNVTSFLLLVERYFGITTDTMRLIRLGSNVSSFISLAPSKRKEYIGKLIEEIDLYMKIYKKLSNDSKIIKVLMSSNDRNRYNCHISDLIVEKQKLSKLYKNIKSFESERDSLLVRIEKIKSLEKDFNIDELRNRRNEALSKLNELSSIEEKVSHLSKNDLNLDLLHKRRNELVDNKISIQSSINSYRLSIDSNLKSIERINTTVKKITADNDIKSLTNAIEDLRNIINNTDSIIRDFILPNYRSEELFALITRLTSFNQIGNMIYSFGNRPIDLYMKLKNKKQSVDKFLKDQAKLRLNGIPEKELNKILSSLFENDSIISPNCDMEQFSTCPFYRISKVVNEMKSDIKETYDDETLNYIQIISKNIDNILNEVSRVSIRLPDNLLNCLREKSVLDNLSNKVSLFDLSDFNEYLSIFRHAEIFQSNLQRLQEFESKLKLYRNSGIDSQINEINRLENDISSFKDKISNLSIQSSEVDRNISEIDSLILIVSKYQDGRKYKSTLEDTIRDTEKVLKPLEESSTEKYRLSSNLSLIENNIHSNREEAKRLENNISTYIRLTKEGEKLAKKYSDLNLLLDASSTTKGIPVVYMSAYLGRIQSLANSLLSIIYDDLTLAKFNVTQDSFEVPYIKNGILVPDVKYGSQSEIALISMALSFAISTGASSKYNILLLDEIDSGLDEKNRSAFMVMLDRQMEKLQAEQVFMISHNVSGMAEIPVDTIRLDDSLPINRSQNVIYQR